MAVAFHAHPPERRRRTSTVAACGCCCCCCCLHSIGGLLGSAITGRSVTIEARKGTTAYWWCLLAFIVITFAASLASEGPEDGWTVGLFFVALLLPGYQLAAALVAGLLGLFLWGPDASRRVGRLAWRGFIGGLIGLGLMAVPIYALSGSGLGATLSALGLVVLVWLCIAFRKGARHAA